LVDIFLVPGNFIERELPGLCRSAPESYRGYQSAGQFLQIAPPSLRAVIAARGKDNAQPGY
jgi:hypothetical protein